MSGFATQPAGHPGAFAHEFENWRWSSHRFGPPLPLKILIVVAAFWIFPPLGIAALAFLLWRLASRTGDCALSRDAWNRGAWGGRRRGASTRNSASEERRREILQYLDEDAFDEFERKQREARDREAFDRFMAERNAPNSPDEPN